MTDTIGTTIYAYDAADRLIAVGGAPYAWDDRGNLTHDGVFTYTYDAAGRLVRAVSITATVQYTYTAEGLRTAQNVDGEVTTFAWDWATAVPELLSDDEALYLVGLDTLGWEEDGAWTYIVPDALGSVRQETDAHGAVVAVREWTPYGIELSAARDGLGYAGEWYDPNLGLQYLRARWYAAQSGRFTTRDPWDGDNKQPATLNPYIYGLNNPPRYVDPTGCMLQPANIVEGSSGESIWLVFSSGDLDSVSGIYGIPWQVLAAVLDSEIMLDTGLEDYFETYLLRNAPLPIVECITRWKTNPGPGLGNIHIDTAQRVSRYFAEYYADNPDMQLNLHNRSVAEVSKLLTDRDFNTQVAAAYVRQLADYRFGVDKTPATGDHSELAMWTMADSISMWHGYRYGVSEISAGGQGFALDDFQNRHYNLYELMDRAKGVGAMESIRGSLILYVRYLNQ